MRAVLQRVKRASVDVGGERVAEIGRGLLVLLCAETGDTPAEADWIAGKLLDLRVFEDDAGRMNLSVRDIGGAVLLVPQFTLAADCRKGRRPSFAGAAEPEHAKELLERVRAAVAGAGVRTEQGRFGERMSVKLVNDGPVTIILERRSSERRVPRSAG